MAVLVFLAAVMTVSMFYGACAPDRNKTADASQNVKIAFTVGSAPVRADVVQAGIDDQIKQVNQQFGGMVDSLPMTFQASTAGSVIKRLIDTAAFLPLAEKNGIKLDNAALEKAYQEEFKDQVSRVRAQFVRDGLIKPTATDKEFSEAVKKKEGRSIEEIEKERNENFKKALADPKQAADVRISLARMALIQSMMAQEKLSDEDLKKTFETVSYKKILLKSGMPGGTPEDRAKSVLTALKGGLKFEAAMDKYSNEIPPPGKKLSATPVQTIGGQALANDPTLAPLATLGVGQNSEAVTVPEGVAIYHVVSRDPNLPKDFATNIETYRKDAVRQRVEADVQKKLEEFEKQPGLLTFNSPGFEAIYAYAQTGASPFGGTFDQKKMEEVAAKAKAALNKNEGYDREAAALAYYSALDSLYNQPGADQKKLRAEKIESVNALLESNENFRLRMDLVDLYLAENDTEKAFDQLTEAAQNNFEYDENGKGRFDQISAKLAQLRAENKIKPEEAKPIIAELDRWKKEKVDYDKNEAEAQAAEAAAKKADDDLRKKEEAEAKKQKAADAAKKPSGQ